MRFALPSFSPILLLICLCTSAGIIATNVADAPNGPAATDFQVHFIDVGTADCIWIHTGDDGIDGNGTLEGYNIIIDGGDAPNFGHVDGYSTAVEYLTKNDRLPVGTTIDWMILTHPHADHCGGLDNFLENYDVLRIVDPGHDPLNVDAVPGTERPNSAYGKFYTAASTERVDGVKSEFISGVANGTDWNWGDELKVRVLHSSTEIMEHDLNNTSIVLSISFTDQPDAPSFLLTGDAEKAAEEWLVSEYGNDLQADVLKAGHHGSESSSTTEFLEAVRPKHIVISSGNQRFSGTLLPSAKSLGRMDEVSGRLSLGTTIWRTDRCDKTPDLVPRGEEAGDDTVIAWVKDEKLSIKYADNTPQPLAYLPTQCQARTQSGAQCTRNRSVSSSYCWQHD